VQIGVVFPTIEMEPDAGAVRAFATGIEELGFRHVVSFDHVIGVDPDLRVGWAEEARALGTAAAFDVTSTFHEPLVLFGYLAAITKLELVTGVLVLPQRQTTLVAKQAAQVDLLAEGRFRLGVGLGWNPVEYESLGQDFATRGARLEEQVALMRQLWTERSVNHHGAFDELPGVGIAPAPVQRPIPIWMGVSRPVAFRRDGRMADGWFPKVVPGPGLDEARGILEAAAIEAGRDPATIGMEGRAAWKPATGVDRLVGEIEAWDAAGATHLNVVTVYAGLSGVDQHLRVLEDVSSALGLRSRVP
jgi:probable F420-dependent oxidoreductase